MACYWKNKNRTSEGQCSGIVTFFVKNVYDHVTFDGVILPYDGSGGGHFNKCHGYLITKNSPYYKHPNLLLPINSTVHIIFEDSIYLPRASILVSSVYSEDDEESLYPIPHNIYGIEAPDQDGKKTLLFEITEDEFDEPVYFLGFSGNIISNTPPYSSTVLNIIPSTDNGLVGELMGPTEIHHGIIGL